MSEVFCTLIYNIIYNKFFDSIDSIQNKYPTLWDEIKDDEWVKKMIVNEPTITKEEIMTHVCTLYYLVNDFSNMIMDEIKK
jgi:hypothetical protein